MEGSIAKAIEMARLAAEAGAWGYKVQLLQPDKIAQTDAPIYWDDKLGNTTQQQTFTRAGLIDYQAWAEAKTACDQFGIEFLATPFDFEAVDALYAIGVTWYKIASGDITHRPLIEHVAATGGSIILSTGASNWFEIQHALEWTAGANDVIVLACTLAYPTPANAAHLGRVETLRHAGYIVGYSDHTSSPMTGMAAAALGSVLNEVHYTLDNNGSDVPDHAMAVTPDVLATYVQASEHGAMLRGSGFVAPVTEELPARYGARRSICAARDLTKGETLTVDDLAYLRPGGGISPADYQQLVGHTLKRPYHAGQPF